MSLNVDELLARKIHQIPAFFLDGYELILCYNCPYAIWNASSGLRIEFKVENEFIIWVVSEVVQLPAEVIEKL